VVKLLRTDTTLDLSQKARVVRKQGGEREVYIGKKRRTDHGLGWVRRGPIFSDVIGDNGFSRGYIDYLLF